MKTEDFPPAISPADHAVESCFWGEEFACYLVLYDQRYYAWIARPFDGGDQVYAMPDADTARAFLTAAQARMLLSTSWGQTVAATHAGDGLPGPLIYSAAVLDGADDGIWLAVSEADGDQQTYVLDKFGNLPGAVEAFAVRTEKAADQIERMDIGWPAVTAARLRYLAAYVRSGAARAALGDVIRGNSRRIRAERAVSRVAAASGISREFLYRVLAGTDWNWQTLMPPPKNVLPPKIQPAVRDAPGHAASWTAWVRFAIEASGESEARSITARVLSQIGLRTAGTPDTAPAGTGLWTVTAHIDLSAVGTFEPDQADTRLRYVSGCFGERVPWRSHMNERQGTFEWPPSFWDRQPGADDQLLDPAIRAAMIRVTAGNSN